MNDPAVKVVVIVVQAVAEEVASYRVWICTMVRLDIVITINQVNKLLQSNLTRLPDSPKVTTPLSQYTGSRGLLMLS